MKLLVQNFCGGGLPRRGTAGSAGYDLMAPAPHMLEPGQWKKIPLGIAIEIPPGFVGLMKGRSGLAFNQGIIVYDGTIDSDYRGELSVLLCNTSDRMFSIYVGDRIAQMIFVRAEVVQPEWTQALSQTERGNNGYGSTGR